MKLNHYYNKKIFIFLYIALMLITFDNSLIAKNNTEEEIKKISLQLRCMSCQNQSIYESNTDFSKDIKNLIKLKLKEGKNEKEIITFLVERYGEYILFKPLINKKNIFLWVFPFALFVISLFFLGSRIKR
tara:strand:+ start:1059 stop:1448 length:390 start_codon:yes stop_codon:yes gene_type:complete